MSTEDERTVRIVLTHSEPERRWCDGCMTSAAYVIRVHRLTDDGVVDFGTMGGCTRCGTGIEGRGSND